jgi:LPLT family lysophospholipid transporter-like MFS transporter
MKAVIVAQFLSAFGDNALLFATLALLKAQFYPEWSQPILQMVFVGAYILFAPFVGQVADSFAKGRVMMFANGLKLLGAASLCFGINPFLGYTLVGVGAAAYSPAKYGILGELTTGSKLVKANGLMEASLTYYPWLIRREYRISPVNRLQHQHPPAYSRETD